MDTSDLTALSLSSLSLFGLLVIAYRLYFHDSRCLVKTGEITVDIGNVQDDIRNTRLKASEEV